MSALADLHGRLLANEERAARVYRAYAKAAGRAQDLRSLWNDLARDTEAHVRSFAEARPVSASRGHRATGLDGCEEAIAAIEQRLLAAEEQADHGNDDDRLIAALELEVTALDLLHAAPFPAGPSASERLEIAVRVGGLIARHSDEVHLIIHAAELIARARGRLRATRRAV